MKVVKAIAAVVGGIALALAYVLLAEGVFGHTAFADPTKYRHANEWFGLNFLLDLPLAALIFVPLFIVIGLGFRSHWHRSLAMVLGVVVAGAGYFATILLYVPADRSLVDETSIYLILAWGLVSVLLAVVARRTSWGRGVV